MRVVAVFLIQLFVLSTVSANNLDELSYEEFIRQFDDTRQTRYKKPSSSTALDRVLLHAGIGYVSSILRFQLPINFTINKYYNGSPSDDGSNEISREEAFNEDGSLKDGIQQIATPAFSEEEFQSYHSGIQFSFGIDLLSPFWQAEGSFRNFGISNQAEREITITEFDMKIVNQNLLSQSLGYRAGVGLGSRFVKIVDKAKSFNEDFSTPTSILFFGLESHLTRQLTLGAELAARSNLVEDTPDKSNIDLTLRMDTHF